MIITEDSEYNKITNKHFNESELQFFDAIKNTTVMIDISYSRLISNLIPMQAQSHIGIAMLDCWSIIDSLNRLRSLLQYIPRLKKNTPWFQKFLRDLKKIEDLRHFIQHYNEKINILLQNNEPLLGHISWAELYEENKIRVGFLVSFRLKEFKFSLVNPVGKVFRNNLDHVTFKIHSYEVNLSDFYYNLIEFTRSMEIFLQQKINNTV